jgi:hypothetical protein
MANVNIHDTMHSRIKRLLADTGGTIGQFVHNACDTALSAAEEQVAKAKASVKAKAKSK